MDFVFKLSFFLHSVTNQNIQKKKKKAKFLIIKKAKIEIKKKSLDHSHFSVLHSVHSPATFSAFSCYIQCIQKRNNIPERDNNTTRRCVTEVFQRGPFSFRKENFFPN